MKDLYQFYKNRFKLLNSLKTSNEPTFSAI